MIAARAAEGEIAFYDVARTSTSATSWPLARAGAR